MSKCNAVESTKYAVFFPQLWILYIMEIHIILLTVTIFDFYFSTIYHILQLKGTDSLNKYSIQYNNRETQGDKKCQKSDLNVFHVTLCYILTCCWPLKEISFPVKRLKGLLCNYTAWNSHLLSGLELWTRVMLPQALLPIGLFLPT